MPEGMSGITPVMSLGGCNEGYNGWGNWGGALIGGAIGGVLGNAWNNNRWNCGNNGCGCSNGIDDLFLMDSISNLRNETSSVGRDQLMQTMTLQSANCQGFSTLNSAVRDVGAQLQNANCQGFSGINTAIRDIGSQVALGQSRTEAAVLTTGLQGQIQAKDNTITSLNAQHANEVQALQNTYNLKSSIDSCCCETNRNIERQGCETRQTIAEQQCSTRQAIHMEGEATRALINKYAYEQLQEKNCDLKSKVHMLETQQTLGGYINNVATQNRQDMQQMLQTIVGTITTATASALNRAGLLIRPETTTATTTA